MQVLKTLYQQQQAVLDGDESYDNYLTGLNIANLIAGQSEGSFATRAEGWQHYRMSPRTANYYGRNYSYNQCVRNASYVARMLKVLLDCYDAAGQKFVDLLSPAMKHRLNDLASFAVEYLRDSDDDIMTVQARLESYHGTLSPAKAATSPSRSAVTDGSSGDPCSSGDDIESASPNFTEGDASPSSAEIEGNFDQLPSPSHEEKYADEHERLPPPARDPSPRPPEAKVWVAIPDLEQQYYAAEVLREHEDEVEVFLHNGTGNFHRVPRNCVVTQEHVRRAGKDFPWIGRNSGDTDTYGLAPGKKMLAWNFSSEAQHGFWVLVTIVEPGAHTTKVSGHGPDGEPMVATVGTRLLRMSQDAEDPIPELS